MDLKGFELSTEGKGGRMNFEGFRRSRGVRGWRGMEG